MIRPAALAGAALAAGLAAATVLVPSAASADPATTASYPVSASATRYAGAAFDTCSAPPLATMQAWTASPFRAVGIYLGGVNRTCGQAQLTRSWVSSVSQLSWRLLPIYKGLQPACGGKPTDQKISLTLATAAAQGTAAANDADTQARALGLSRGSAVYNDLEHYPAADAGCRASVLTYLSAWTRRLHQLGYVSGEYVNLNSGAQDLAGTYGSATYARPDAVWIARYDGSTPLTGWAGVPDTQWPVHQRAKQYRGTHSETYGGVTVSIDSDQVDAPVATVGHGYAVTAASGVYARSGPATSYPVVKAYPAGAAVTVVCQAPGARVATTNLWDKLPDGSYVSDYNVSTPSKTTYSGLAGRCLYPYQVTPAAGANERSGPGASYALAGHLASGALAWVTCQRPGSKVAGTAVWDKLQDGRFVSDAYVATAGTTGYTRPIPRC